MKRLCLFGLLWLLSLHGIAEPVIPQFTQYVTDQTNTLTAEEQAMLEARLVAFQQQKGSQVALLIVDSTKPLTIEQYSIQVAETWQLGRKKIDDGVLVLLAKGDKKMRIEVGYGLEGAIPDAIAKRLIEEVFVPELKAGRFFQAVDAGLTAILKVIDGEPLPLPKFKYASSGQSQVNSDILIVLIIILFVFAGILKKIFGDFFGSGIGGLMAGFIAWFVFTSLAVAGLVFVGMFILLLLSGLFIPAGYVGGHRTSSWGGSGRGYSGGGFGGGMGGGFGGGGASGGW